MTREQKYPDTKSFHYYNANPKNRKGGDCVVRAVANALDQSWEQTVREMTEVGIQHGFVLNDTHTYDKYLQSKGFMKCMQPRKHDNTKYTGEEWCEMLDRVTKKGDWGAIVANIGGHHAVCIKPLIDEDGTYRGYRVWDIWDSTDGCIGNYWMKKRFTLT